MKHYPLCILDKLYLEVSLFSFLVLKTFICVAFQLQSSKYILSFQPLKIKKRSLERIYSHHPMECSTREMWLFLHLLCNYISDLMQLATPLKMPLIYW